MAGVVAGIQASVSRMAGVVADEGDEDFNGDQIVGDLGYEIEHSVNPDAWSTNYVKDCISMYVNGVPTGWAGHHWRVACDTCLGFYCSTCGRTGMFKSPCTCQEACLAAVGSMLPFGSKGGVGAHMPGTKWVLPLKGSERGPRKVRVVAPGY